MTSTVVEIIEPSDIKNAANKLRQNAESSDIAMRIAKKLAEQTNEEIQAICSSTDSMMARITKISNKLADPQKRSEKMMKRKEERLQKRMQKQIEKSQQIINYWSKKYLEHMITNDIISNEDRENDEYLFNIEEKLNKLDIDCDELFNERKIPKAVFIPAVKCVQNERRESDQEMTDDKYIDIHVKQYEDDVHAGVYHNVKILDDNTFEIIDDQSTVDTNINEKKSEIITDEMNISSNNDSSDMCAYPGLSNMKPISSLSTYKPSTLNMNNHGSINSPSINTMCFEPSNEEKNTFYPSVKNMKPMKKFKKYEPMISIINSSNIVNNEMENDDELLDDLDDVVGVHESLINDLHNNEYQNGSNIKSNHYPDISGMKKLSKKEYEIKVNRVQMEKIDDDELLDDLEDVDTQYDCQTNENNWEV